MTVSLSEVARYMRMGRNLPEGELKERTLALMDKAQREIRPTRIWRRFGMDEIRSSFEINGTIARHLNGCHAAYLACGTIGAAFDAFQRRESTLSGANALIVQAIGAAMIEKWMDIMNDDIRRELADGEELISRYSPGYGDFPLSAQRTLLALLDASLKTGVTLTDTFLMVPSKSVSAIIGVKKNEE